MIDKKTMNGIMAMLSILVLLIPIGVSGYIQEETITNIISVQGDYTDGDNIGLYAGTDANITEIFAEIEPAYSVDNPLGWDANNDTIFQGYKSSGIYQDRDGTYYGNYNTYTGGGNHTMIVDWADVPESTYNSLRYLYVPLNITNADLVNYDFIKIHTSINTDNGALVRFGINSGTNLNEVSSYDIDDDSYLFVFDTSMKSIMDANPNGTAILFFSAITGDFDETQTSFTWCIEAYNMEPSDYLFGSEFTDFTIWIAMMVGLDAIFIYVAIFSNPWFDTKLDIKKNKWRK